jgi:hypothetical protein
MLVSHPFVHPLLALALFPGALPGAAPLPGPAGGRLSACCARCGSPGLLRRPLRRTPGGLRGALGLLDDTPGPGGGFPGRAADSASRRLSAGGCGTRGVADRVCKTCQHVVRGARAFSLICHLHAPFAPYSARPAQVRCHDHRQPVLSNVTVNSQTAQPLRKACRAY